MNCSSNYTLKLTRVFSFPKEEDLNIRSIRFVNQKDWEFISSSYICLKHSYKKVKTVNISVTNEYEICYDYIRSKKSY